MKTIKYAFIFGLFFTLNACSTTTVIPRIGNLSTVIANGENETEAAKLATIKARRICSLDHQQAKIVDLETQYLGPNSDQKDVINLAKKILPKSKTYEPIVPKDYTYKSTLTFRCVPFAN